MAGRRVRPRPAGSRVGGVDDRAFKALRSKLDRELSGVVAKVGVFGGGTIADLASTHEFGSRPGKLPRVPERSFLRRTFINEKDRFRAHLTKAAKRVVEGRVTASVALEAIGQLAAAAVKNTIARGPHIPPPLADSTVARRKKRSNRPLVDTGHNLLAAITHKVERGAGKAVGLWR